MSNNDPFAEPDDADRTVIKPNLGGRRSTAPQPAAQSAHDPMADPMAPPAQAAPAAAYGMPQQATPQAGASGSAPGEPGFEAGMTGMNRLNAAAATLFSLVSRIRNRAQHMDPDKLRRSVIAEVRAFENRCLQGGIDAQEVKIARYAICATLDDVVLNTPWGSQSSWAMQSMVATFHKETVGGDRFYDLLARLEREPAKNIDLLEFLYMCLSLGFEGRLRVEQGGVDRHMQIRAGLARIIRGQRGPAERDLSPRWKGIDLPHKVLSIWKPVWLTTAAVALLLTGVFVTLSWLLSRETDRVVTDMAALDDGSVVELFRRAPPPPPPPPAPVTPLPNAVQAFDGKGFLEDEIAENLVEVIDEATTVTIRISGQNMFASASDQLQPEYFDRIRRVGEELAQVNGRIIVVGHSDNIPIRSSRWQSNMHLSLARAEAVMNRIKPLLDAPPPDTSDKITTYLRTGDAAAAEGGPTPQRITAEGRADKEPIASNDTTDGRARNRRIEIILIKESAT